MTGRPSAASRVPAAMRPAFRRGWVGEGKAESSTWHWPAGEARHTGAAIPALGTKGQSPWRSHTTNKRRRLASLNREAEKKRHPCTAQRSRRPCARACGPAGVRQGERQECQRVSAKMLRPQERKARNRARPQLLPLHFPRSRSLPQWAGTKDPVRASG